MLAARVPPLPAFHAPGPEIRHLRQNVDSGAHVLAALGIVRRSGVHRVRPALRPRLRKTMELLHPPWLLLSADFVHGKQTVVDVESGVFLALGHYRPGKLLPALHKLLPA